jgi:hypothetical protein
MGVGAGQLQGHQVVDLADLDGPAVVAWMKDTVAAIESFLLLTEVSLSRAALVLNEELQTTSSSSPSMTVPGVQLGSGKPFLEVQVADDR